MLHGLALASAVFYGAADFLGGLAARRASAIPIVVISQVAGLFALVLMLPFLPASSPSRYDVMWGAAAGVTGGIGVALLYHALATGTMAIVAPITAVCAVTVPVGAAIAFGERPGTGATSGIALAIVAIVLVSRQGAIASPLQRDGATNSSLQKNAVASWRRGGEATGETRSAGTALASGVAIGLFFLTLAQSGPNAGMWPLVAARAVSFLLFATLALVTRKSLRMKRDVAALAIAGGVLDMLANLLYLLATRYGQLSLVVTLSSLYPASTVLLARLVLGERLSGGQTAGIVCALIAVMLIVGSR
jgi:drug/metabolite transporter (DMT)-like permease